MPTPATSEADILAYAVATGDQHAPSGATQRMLAVAPGRAQADSSLIVYDPHEETLLIPRRHDRRQHTPLGSAATR